MKSKMERALIAVGLHGHMVLLATDGPWIANDADAISPNPEDIGIDPLPSERGIYLWEGVGEMVSYSIQDGCDPPEPAYSGTIRRVRPEELECLLKMEPPEDSNANNGD